MGHCASHMIYAMQEVDVIPLEAQFPVIPESNRASTSTERFRQAVWNQLDSLRCPPQLPKFSYEKEFARCTCFEIVLEEVCCLG